MKVNRITEDINDGLSNDSLEIKNIIMKAMTESLTESYRTKNINKICEDFNAGKVILSPVDKDDVVLAYNPKMRLEDKSVIIEGYATSSHKGEPNVKITLTQSEFFNLLAINK